MLSIKSGNSISKNLDFYIFQGGGIALYPLGWCCNCYSPLLQNFLNPPLELALMSQQSYMHNGLFFF